MARPVLSAKGEKWPCAIKMKLEMVLTLGSVFSFFPVVLRLSIAHSDPLLSISCSPSHLSSPTQPQRRASHKATLCTGLVWGRQTHLHRKKK